MLLAQLIDVLLCQIKSIENIVVEFNTNTIRMSRQNGCTGSKDYMHIQHKHSPMMEFFLTKQKIFLKWQENLSVYDQICRHFACQLKLKLRLCICMTCHFYHRKWPWALLKWRVEHRKVVSITISGRCSIRLIVLSLSLLQNENTCIISLIVPCACPWHTTNFDTLQRTIILFNIWHSLLFVFNNFWLFRIVFAIQTLTHSFPSIESANKSMLFRIIDHKDRTSKNDQQIKIANELPTNDNIPVFFCSSLNQCSIEMMKMIKPKASFFCVAIVIGHFLPPIRLNVKRIWVTLWLSVFFHFQRKRKYSLTESKSTEPNRFYAWSLCVIVPSSIEWRRCIGHYFEVQKWHPYSVVYLFR